ncbi:hypothetical protein PoB_000643900 [Plakobranchus ocellatus]|uniref:Uncharacterized protein n=1 Tax=Plakobranchus ocellatus TaxID=259542 RepID=A0AAV3YAD2_9GAST|nr:hypothetical protein PoB_000643900 [Plakobranchus ocellatus]
MEAEQKSSSNSTREFENKAHNPKCLIVTNSNQTHLCLERDTGCNTVAFCNSLLPTSCLTGKLRRSIGILATRSRVESVFRLGESKPTKVTRSVKSL